MREVPDTVPAAFRARLPPQTSRVCEKMLGYSTRASHVITHRSTNLACWCLTSQIRRDGVLSPEYGRIREWFREGSGRGVETPRGAPRVGRKRGRCRSPPRPRRRGGARGNGRGSPASGGQGEGLNSGKKPGPPKGRRGRDPQGDPEGGSKTGSAQVPASAPAPGRCSWERMGQAGPWGARGRGEEQAGLGQETRAPLILT